MILYALLLHALKTGVCLAVFYLFFKLLLGRETFHRLNRILILGAIVVSLVLPLCVITVYREAPAGFLPELSAGEPVVAAATAAADSGRWQLFAGVLFLAGAVATLAFTLRSLADIRRIVRRGTRRRLDDGTSLVVVGEAIAPFSWGGYIVISADDLDRNGSAILAHERAHVRFRHSWDLLLTDLAGCLQWFNPAMWLLRRELRAIHEYEADEAVLDSGVDARQYQLLLIRKAAGGRWYSVANSFNHSKLKNRITMMLQKRSSRWAAAKALLTLPLVALALGAFARTAYVVPDDKQQGKDTKKVETVVISGLGKSDPSAPKPVYIVDGIRLDDLSSIDPAQIASISVLKGKTAVEQYGEEGRDGAVVVTTKKAAENAEVRNGSTSTSVSTSSDGKTTVTVVRNDGETLPIVSVTRSDQTGTATTVTSTATTDRISTTSVTTTDSADPERSGSTVRITGNITRVYTSDWQDALILIDGKKSSTKKVEKLKPSQIKSITILKDKAAVDRYGDEGRDGVVLIETK